MRVVIAGGHGQIALVIERLLVERGDEAVGLVRNPDHVADLEQLGASAAVVDLESVGAEELAPLLHDADAVIFAAGAGPGSGAGRKKTVDEGAARILADAAKIAGVDRYVMVSAIGADQPRDGLDEVFAAYLEAKAAADDYLRKSGLDWTIVRPGGLTNDPATGSVTLASTVDRGPITRADVAAVVVGALDQPSTITTQFEVVNGPTPITDALR